MRRRIPIRGCVRRSVRVSVAPSVGPSVPSYVHVLSASCAVCPALFLLVLFKSGEMTNNSVKLIASFRNEKITILDLLSRLSGVADFSVIQVILDMLTLLARFPPVQLFGLKLERGQSR